MYTYVKKIYKHLWENEHLGSRSKFVPEAAIIKSIRKSQLNIYIPVIYHLSLIHISEPTRLS